MPPLAFDLPHLLRCAADLGLALRDQLPQFGNLYPPAEGIEWVGDETLEVLHVRLVQALLPYPDRELTDLLLRDLTTPRDLAEDLPDREECARLARWSQLLRDCECGAQSLTPRAWSSTTAP